MQMARKNDKWLIVILVSILTIVGVICIFQRKPGEKTPEPFNTGQKQIKRRPAPSAPQQVQQFTFDDNIELIDE